MSRALERMRRERERPGAHPRAQVLTLLFPRHSHLFFRPSAIFSITFDYDTGSSDTIAGESLVLEAGAYLNRTVVNLVIRPPPSLTTSSSDQGAYSPGSSSRNTGTTFSDSYGDGSTGE